MKGTLMAVTLALAIFFTSTSALALCVSDPEANLRSGPGTKYEKTWQVFKYMPFKRLSKKGLWYKVRDVDGDTHWIYGKLVTSKYKCAVVSNDRANVRTAPGTKSKQTEFSPVLRYYAFKVLKIQGEWVHVEDQDGDRGWIFRKLLWIP